MKKEQPNARLLDPLVGRARRPKQSGTVAEHPPVGRETARCPACRGRGTQTDQMNGMRRKCYRCLGSGRAANGKLTR